MHQIILYGLVRVVVGGCVSFIRVKEVYGYLPNFLEDHEETEGDEDKRDWYGDDHQEEDKGDVQDGLANDDVFERIPDTFQGESSKPWGGHLDEGYGENGVKKR
ncbi:hypothetical protein L6452_39050 [Arctium lappa]|uniref:Uncharacterized protein n=1 Tax=Arctium lappa TaxID=4217 RepID=A0ACB8XRZ8_ARCLA|nr:hypothetical protein L6452_39050 [Arctium lappa]